MALLIGLAGMAGILAAFLLEEFSPHTAREQWAYNLLNLGGALLLAWYSWLIWSLPFLILNVVWTLVAAWRLARPQKA